MTDQLLSPADIVVRLGRPIGRLDNGNAVCPVCGLEGEGVRLGPHFAKHWREAGITQPPVGADPVKCPITGCERRTLRRNLAGHLESVHEYTSDNSRGMARIAGFTLDDAQSSAVRDDIDSGISTTDVAPAAMEPDEMALAVVMTAANGNIPTAALPDVIAYIDATRQLVSTLRGDQ